MISKNLCNLNNDVVIYTNYLNNEKQMDRINNIVIKKLPIRNLNNINKKSMNIINEDKIDLIYWFGHPLIGLYIKSFSLNLPIVVNISSVHYSLKDLRPLLYYEYFDHLVHFIKSVPPLSYFVRLLNNNQIKTIIVQSIGIEKSLILYGVNKNKIKVAPLAFEKDDLNKISNKKNNADDKNEAFYVTYLGSPNTIRGTDIIIKSALTLKNHHDKLKFIILSRRKLEEKNIYEEHLNKLIKKWSLEHMVEIIPGILERDLLDSYIIKSSLILLPFKISISEPPLSIFEAMQKGKVVITSDTCGLSEFVNNNKNLLITPGNYLELAQKILFFLMNPKIRKKIEIQNLEFINSLITYEELGLWTNELLTTVFHSSICK